MEFQLDFTSELVNRILDDFDSTSTKLSLNQFVEDRIRPVFGLMPLNTPSYDDDEEEEDDSEEPDSEEALTDTGTEDGSEESDSDEEELTDTATD